MSLYALQGRNKTIFMSEQGEVSSLRDSFLKQYILHNVIAKLLFIIMKPIENIPVSFIQNYTWAKCFFVFCSLTVTT